VSWQSIAADVALGVAVLVVAASSAGMLVMRGAFAKVHFVTPIGVVAPILVAVAVTLRSGWSEPTGQTWLAVGFLCVAGPVLGHATVRAIRVRERGDWRDRRGVLPADDDR